MTIGGQKLISYGAVDVKMIVAVGGLIIHSRPVG
jgi:hypothetical protein